MYNNLQKIKAKDCIDIKLNNQLIYIYIYSLTHLSISQNKSTCLFKDLTFYSKIYFHDSRSNKRLIPQVGLILVPILTSFYS